MVPEVLIHNAVSLDGRTVGFEVNMGLFYGLAGEWQEDLTLAGSNTILQARDLLAGEAPAAAPNDEPLPRGRLAIVDSRGRVEDWSFLMSTPFWGSFVALCSQTTPREHIARLEAQGVETIVAGEERVDLRAALEQLHERYGAGLVRVESGGILNSVLMSEGLVSEVSLLVHPVIVGGNQPGWIDVACGQARLHLEKSLVIEGQYVWSRYKVLHGQER